MGTLFLCMCLIVSIVVIKTIQGKVFPETIKYDVNSDIGQSQSPVDDLGYHHVYHGDGKDPLCTRETTTLTCKTIPKVVKMGITNVVVTSQVQNIPEHQFIDKSWTQVHSLYIQGSDINLDKDGLFQGLINLTALFLNSSLLNRYSSSCFSGLDRLTNLTLVGMNTLDGVAFQLAVSEKSVLPKLKSISLNPAQRFRSIFMKVKKEMLDSFIFKQLQCLHISRIIFEIKLKDMEIFFLRHSLKVLNVSGSFIVIDGYIKNLQATLSLPFVDVLDTSSVSIAVVNTDVSSDLINNRNMNYSFGPVKHYISQVFFFVETWYYRSVWLEQTDVNIVTDISSRRVFWKKIVFTDNNVPIMNTTAILPVNNTLYHLDLSSNKMRYLGTGIFVTGFALRELRLANNKLYEMEHLPEFEGLLSTLKKLTLFDLASNSISFIPEKMFQFNEVLETLILENNSLNSLTFELEHLERLRYLNLKGNMIMFLQGDELYNVQMIVKKYQGRLDILFQGNPIACSCATVKFISWLVSLQRISRRGLQCSYEGDDVALNNAVVGKCNFLCKRTMIISISVACSLTIVLVILMAIRQIKRARERTRKKNVEWVLRERILAGTFLCFTAISGDDEDLAERVMLRTLRRILQVRAGTDKDVICTGKRFRPGFSICEESYRLLKMSYVFVGVVSNAFVRSQYCRSELQEACKQDKPIILLFHGHVDTEDMPQYMQEVFRRNCRAWIKQNDEGYYYMVPNVKDVGGAIWDLAIADLIKQG